MKGPLSRRFFALENFMAAIMRALHWNVVFKKWGSSTFLLGQQMSQDTVHSPINSKINKEANDCQFTVIISVVSNHFRNWKFLNVPSDLNVSKCHLYANNINIYIKFIQLTFYSIKFREFFILICMFRFLSLNSYLTCDIVVHYIFMNVHPQITRY